MTTKTKARQTRVTKSDIDKARNILLDQPEIVRQTTKIANAPKWHKDQWYGLVYCDSYGWAWIAGLDFQGVWLGKTEEVIKILKRRKVDDEDVAQVLQAVREFRTEIESQSYHSDIENGAGGMNGHVASPKRITFKKDPQFLKLMDNLIQKDYGLPTIQKELRIKGYDVPYATLGRWIKKRKVKR